MPPSVNDSNQSELLFHNALLLSSHKVTVLLL